MTGGLGTRDTAAASDGDLLGRVRAGDTRAFDTLVRRHLEPAVRLATRLLGGDDAAGEDVVQDSFIAVLESVDAFDPKRSFAPWFYRIVANRCANVRRTRSRQATETLSRSLESGRPGPDREAARGALRSRLRAGLERLPDRQREVLMLYDVEGFAGAEIAEMLEISPVTVRWHLHQARAAMRAIMDGEVEEDT
jgi:RNA polymerase sigma factor (sigma-70 family)